MNKSRAFFFAAQGAIFFFAFSALIVASIFDENPTVRSGALFADVLVSLGVFYALFRAITKRFVASSPTEDSEALAEAQKLSKAKAANRTKKRRR